MACQASADERSPEGFPRLLRLAAASAWHPSLLATRVAKAGGGNRVRTGDPELAKLVLCQLSYAPSL